MSIARYLEDQGATVPNRIGWAHMKCPYHDDRSASASVNVHQGKFHCFACDIYEDVIGLIMREGASYAEAKQQAETKYGQGERSVSGESARSGLLPVRTGNKPHAGRTVRARRSNSTIERL